MGYISERASAFHARFMARSDLYAEQQPPDADCHDGVGHYHPVYERLDVDSIQAHLAGSRTLGIYTVNAANYTRHLAWDIDTGKLEDALEVAVATGLPPDQLYLEFSGRKGYHVWAFLAEPVEASLAYEAVRAVLYVAGMEGTEAYPKQPEVTGKGMGNLIKLPLGKHLANGGMSTSVLDQDYPDWWQTQAIGPAELVRMASFAPKVVRPAAGSQFVPSDKALLPCIHRILHGGVPKGMRDNAGYTVALDAMRREKTEEEATELLTAALPMFYGTPEATPRWAATKARNAYSRGRPGFDCRTHILHDPGLTLCSRKCPRYQEGFGLATDDAPEGAAQRV